MSHRSLFPVRFLPPAVIILSILACTLTPTGGQDTPQEPPSASDSNAEALADLPELASFADLVIVDTDPVTVEVGPEAGTVKLSGGASIQIPAGAFPVSNQLDVDQVEVAFDQIAPDVRAGRFYVVSTREEVPLLGAPLVLEIPRPGAEVTVVVYEDGTWLPVQVEPGKLMRISINHFSKGVFGFFEWWSERDVELGETLDSMDNDSAQAHMRIAIEGGNESVRSFFGVDEQSTQTDTEICAEFMTMLQQFNKPQNRQFPVDEGGTIDLADFLFAGASPSQQGGQFWNMTSDSMDVIRDNLLGTEGQIGPAEFLKIAIEANNGNVPLGVLAAHNYLKTVTYMGRTTYNPKNGLSPEYGDPASHLRSWRQGTNITAAGEYDKMGPLYHIFAAMTGALWLPTRASGPAIASGEAFLRTFRVGADRPDTSKAAADQCGIDIAAWLRNHPPEEESDQAEVQPPASVQVITKTGEMVMVGLDPGIRVTENSISLTYQDDGKAEVTGSADFAAIYLWEECSKELPGSTRWELTGQYDPATRRFTGSALEYGAGQITYTDCSVGTVEEYLRGEGGTWEAVLNDGVITGNITLIQSGGTLLLRVTFELR